ncbi:MAG: hypothetical protein JJU20_02350 [Opitutales bacterium]|nr:hypothetical protein [Opitutales bacterium]
MKQQARILAICSAIALVVAPIVAMAGAFEINFLLIGLTLFIAGALGLYASMRRLGDD